MALEDSEIRQRKKKSPRKTTDAITGQVVDDTDLVKTGIENLQKIKRSLVASSDSVSALLSMFLNQFQLKSLFSFVLSLSIQYVARLEKMPPLR